MSDSIKFTQSDKDFFAVKRKEQQHVDQLFKDIRSLMEQFPGSRITYLQIEEREWGKPSPPGVVPNVPSTIPVSKKQNQKATTLNAKRVAVTKYKE